MGTRTRLILVGAGHAHLHVMRAARRLEARGIDCVLVEPDAFWYSGLATGVLGGRHPAEADRIDPEALVAEFGGRLVRARATGIDHNARRLEISEGDPLAFDALSFNLGSEVDLRAIEGARHARRVKPIAGLCALGGELAQGWARGTGPRRLLVVGGGAAGCEVAANLAERARRVGAAVEIVLVHRGPRLLEAHPERAGYRAQRLLERGGVEVRLSTPIVRVEPQHVEVVDGRRLASDLTLLATGLVPPRVTADLGLRTDRAGAIRVDAELRALGEERIFAVGDCTTFEPRPLPRVGVYGVRAAPVLLHNLEATLLGGALRPFRPQRRFLLILNLGRGRGLALRGQRFFAGRLALWWKDRLDRRFLARYRGR